MTLCLIDTGPLVAYLDAGDPAHLEVVAHLDRYTGQLATTSAVLTEAMHFVSDAVSGPRTLTLLIEAASIGIYDLCRLPELQEAVLLMEKYSDTPMDFADATLVLLAEGLDAHRIFSLDRRGFSTFRTRRGEPFELMLDQSW